MTPATRMIHNNNSNTDITERKMKGKAYHVIKMLCMLSELASSVKYQEVNRSAEDQEEWRATN